MTSIVFAFVMGTWIGGAIFQTTFTRADAPVLRDWAEPGWAGPFVLYCRESVLTSPCKGHTRTALIPP